MKNKTKTSTTAPVEESKKDEFTLPAAVLEQKTGLGYRQLSRIAAQGYFPKPRHMKFHLTETVWGIVKYFKDQAGDRLGKAAAVRLEREQERLKREKIETSRVAEEVVDKVEVKREIARHVTSAKTRLLAIPSSAAPVLAGLMDPVEIEAKLKTFVHDALDELSGIVK